MVLPPLIEQQAIASFLDAKTKPIDDIIAKREKQIELLEEMKSARDTDTLSIGMICRTILTVRAGISRSLSSSLRMF